MVRKALHVAWKAGKEVFAMTSHVRALSSTSLAISVAERFSGFGGHHSGGCGRQFSENRIKM